MSVIILRVLSEGPRQEGRWYALDADLVQAFALVISTATIFTVCSQQLWVTLFGERS